MSPQVRKPRSPGIGMRVRFRAIPGETPKTILNRPLYLPVTLGGFAYSETAAHSEYDTIRAGQFSQPAMGPASARQLRTVDDLGTLTVSWDAPWIIDEGRRPTELHRALFDILRSKRPVELSVRSKHLPLQQFVRFLVTFRSVDPEVRENEPDTIYYSIQVAEWRPAKVRRRSSRERNPGGGERYEGPWGGRPGGRSDLPMTITLTGLDTLATLAGRYMPKTPLGAATRAIYEANGLQGSFGKHTELAKHGKLKAGSKLKIPKAPDAR